MKLSTLLMSVKENMLLYEQYVTAVIGVHRQIKVNPRMFVMKVTERLHTIFR